MSGVLTRLQQLQKQLTPSHNTTSSTAMADQAVSAQTSGHRSLPLPSPCLSYWHRTTRAFPHLNANHDQPVPASCDYCIIGSGMSGCLTAFELLELGVPGEEIVILEAREAVSGATGRNAGHCRPDAFRGYSAYAGVHGNEQAKKIIENEKEVLERVRRFVVEHDVQCDFNDTTTFDVCLTHDFAKYEAESLDAYRAAGGDVTHVKIHHGADAKTTTGVEAALGAYEWPAASVHPAKLAQWLLSNAIARGVQLWTHTPVEKVSKHEDASNDRLWMVHTNRGSTITTKVIHCTNAYAAYLLPELERFVTPNRAQANSIIPDSSRSGSNIQTKTMSLRYGLKHFFSLIQRPADGTVIFGISRDNPDLSIEARSSLVTFDDSRPNEEIASTIPKEYQRLFLGDVAATEQRYGEGADYAWCGILGMTPDSVPLVGPIPGKAGQWVCAGFNGHGMARIFTCAPGLVQLMKGQAWSATGLPECFQFTAERLEKAAKGNVKSVW